MHGRNENWCFGRVVSTPRCSWLARHEPTVDRWLTEMEKREDPWWPSAEHAAFCLVSYLEMNVEHPSWRFFHVGEFLFSDLWEGGTVGMFGSHVIFFDHLVEAFRRFHADGVVDHPDAQSLINEMIAARQDFVACYSEETEEEESCRIARRHWDLGSPLYERAQQSED